MWALGIEAEKRGMWCDVNRPAMDTDREEGGEIISSLTSVGNARRGGRV